MNVQVKHMADFEDELKRLMLSEMHKLAKQELERIKTEVIKQLSRTLLHALPRGERDKYTKGLGDARIAFKELLIKKESNGVIVRVEVRIEDKGGSPHKIWHLLNEGSSGKSLAKSIRFPLRKSNRTFPNELDAQAFSGYQTGSNGKKKWVTLRKGRKLAGIAPRNWYKKAFETIIKNLDVSGTGSYSDSGNLFEIDMSKSKWNN